SALAYTAQLAIVAATLALLLGVTLGIVAALRRGSRTDLAISTFAASSLSIPGFALGTVLILVVSVELGLLPPAGAGQPGQSFGTAVEFTLMPAFTLAIPVAAVLIRYIRVTLGETMAQDYIVTARSKGLKRSTIVVQHGLRNALIPTITVAGIQLGGLLAGAVVVETVFSYPGLGRLTIQAIRGVDYPVVQGALLLAAATFLILTFLVDIAYGLIDPRIRVQ
ncbi:MAG: ABC transporter permease, partial [Geodermatophilaceae bacterium]|nr:ABC transporter permease [Geodermatophilaceae bacterium]